MVDEMEAAWESRSPMERARMHRTSANSTAHPRIHQWSRHLDQTSSERAGGYPDKNKGGGRPAGLSQGGGQRGVWSGDQGARIPFNKSIKCFGCGNIGHIKKECPEAKLRMIYSDLELEELVELVRVGNINGIPCKCLIDTGANRTIVPASSKPISIRGKQPSDLLLRPFRLLPLLRGLFLSSPPSHRSSLTR